METSRRLSSPLLFIPMACGPQLASIPQPTLKPEPPQPALEALQFCEALRTAAGFKDSLGAGMSDGDPNSLHMRISRFAEMSPENTAPYVTCDWEVDESEFNEGQPIPKPTKGYDLPSYYDEVSNRLETYIQLHGPLVPKKPRKLTHIGVSQAPKAHEEGRMFSDGEPYNDPDGRLDNVWLYRDLMTSTLSCVDDLRVTISVDDGVEGNDWNRCLELLRRKNEFQAAYRRVMKGFLDGLQRGRVQPYSRFNRQR